MATKRRHVVLRARGAPASGSHDRPRPNRAASMPEDVRCDACDMGLTTSVTTRSITPARLPSASSLAAPTPAGRVAAAAASRTRGRSSEVDAGRGTGESIAGPMTGAGRLSARSGAADEVVWSAAVRGDQSTRRTALLLWQVLRQRPIPVSEGLVSRGKVWKRMLVKARTDGSAAARITDRGVGIVAAPHWQDGGAELTSAR